MNGGESSGQIKRHMNLHSRPANLQANGGISNHPYTALGIYPFDGYDFSNGQEYKDGMNDFGKFDLRMRTRMKSSQHNF